MEHLKNIKQVDVKKQMMVKDLLKEFSGSGVMGAGRLAKAVDIASEMKAEKKAGLKVFFGLAGAMVPGGMKNIMIDMLDSGYIDVFVTTGANLTHDMAECLGFNHYQGDSDADDAKLLKQGYDRMFDAYMPNKVYGDMEDFFKKNFESLKEKETIKDFLWELGRLLPSKNRSILKTCYEKKIPIFCPAISDSGIGLMIWGNLAQGKKISTNAFSDLKEMISLAWDAKKAGVFYVGGGVPKNFIQQAMQLSPKAAEFGIQITMDRPESGGSSGADLKEGISWGKMNPKAKFVTVICDTTIALPIVWACVK